MLNSFWFVFNPNILHFPGISGYPHVQAQNVSGSQVNINAVPATVPANNAANTHIRQQILRRKKLVAHSKLAKQMRPHQHNQKLNEANTASDGQAQGFQKLQHQISVTPPNKTPNQSPQAGSQKPVDPSTKQQEQTPSIPNAAPLNPAHNKDANKPLDKASNMVPQKQNPTPKQVNVSSNTSNKQDVQLQAPSSGHMHPPNYHHAAGPCHENQEDGSSKNF